MSALTTDQIITIRRKVGGAPDDAALQVIYDRNGGDVDSLILEVLEIRLADMRRNPMSFSVPGEYSESRSAEQMKALADEISDLRASMGLEAEGLSLVKVAQPSRPRCR